MQVQLDIGLVVVLPVLAGVAAPSPPGGLAAPSVRPIGLNVNGTN